MQILVPVDSESAMLKDLNAMQGNTQFCPVFATIPHDVEDKIPCAVIMRTGGYRTDKVVDLHYLVLRVYANDDNEALETISVLAGIAEELAYENTTASGIDWLGVEMSGFPAMDPDDRHPDLAVFSFEIAATCRARALEI